MSYLVFVSWKDLGGTCAHDDEGNKKGNEQHIWDVSFLFLFFKPPEFRSKA